jgi:hypothetical protein
MRCLAALLLVLALITIPSSGLLIFRPGAAIGQTATTALSPSNPHQRPFHPWSQKLASVDAIGTPPIGALLELGPIGNPRPTGLYLYCLVLFVVFLVLYLTWVLYWHKHMEKRKHNPLPGFVTHEPDLRTPKP